jgi:two-component system NtrC family response regulator
MTRDAAMLRVCRTIEKVARADATVMLLGESRHRQGGAGAGPARGRRSQGKLRRHQLRGHPGEPAGSELFGYEKGAFTGAAKTTPGKIETAQQAAP